MRSVLALLTLTACSFSVEPGATVGDARGSDALPDGAVAGDAMIDAMIDSGTVTPLDTDGDTVPDTVDNCPALANLAQRDHDADTIGDLCDHCPHIAAIGGADPDGDSDGVGDACDPRPTNNADRLVLFAGFYDASEVALWGGGGGLWTVTNGIYRQQNTTGPAGRGPVTAVNRAFVMTEYTLTSSGNSSVGVAAGQSGVAQLHQCVVSKSGSNLNVRSDSFWPTNNQQNSSVAWGGTYDPGSVITLRQELTSDGNRCTASQGGTENSSNATVNAANIGGRVYLGTNDASAEFRYLFIVDEAP